MLRSDQGRAGIDCLKRLGLAEETIDRFRLGYAIEGRRGLVDHLKDKGYLDDQIIEAGLREQVKDELRKGYRAYE